MLFGISWNDALPILQSSRIESADWCMTRPEAILPIARSSSSNVPVRYRDGGKAEKEFMTVVESGHVLVASRKDYVY